MTWKVFLRKVFGKITGVKKLQEQVDTAFYFLNHYCDITAFPKASGALGKMQEGDTLLLRIVDQICKKHNLQYWLDGGTLLGAIRHKGFIPWDDDMYICMLRSDYERAVSILKDELGKYGIDAIEDDNKIGVRIAIQYMHNQTGLWIDLMPFDSISEDVSVPPVKTKVLRSIAKCKRVYRRKMFLHNLSREQVLSLHKKIIPSICEEENAKSVIYCIEGGMKNRTWSISDIFPLKTAWFEGFEFPVPRNVDAYFEQFYGKNYMSFPKDGVGKHADDHKGSLDTWAEKSGTDIDQVINYLQEVLRRLA